MKCTSCGENNSAGGFCEYCGAKLEGDGITAVEVDVDVDDDSDGEDSEVDFNKPMTGRGLSRGMKLIIRVAVVCALVIPIAVFTINLIAKVSKEQKVSEMNNRFGSEIERDVHVPVDTRIQDRESNPLPDYNALYAQNNDMVGYIRIGNTRVDYPVLQTDNNEYYLGHDFDRQPSEGGAIFADYRNRFEESVLSDNTILYGQNGTTGVYFSELSNYYTTTTGIRDINLSFYKSNPVISFDTLYERMEWKVFACVLVNTQEQHGEVFDYSKRDFANEDEFHNFILGVMDRSVLFTDIDIEYGDKVLTLVTPYYPFSRDIETRVVVFARQVRAGESSSVDTAKATHNSEVLRFTEESRRFGSTWNGRVWNYALYLTSYDSSSSGQNSSMTTVPDLVGRWEVDAWETANQRGLSVDIRYEISSEEMRGKVVRQSHPANAEVAVNTVVEVFVGMGDGSPCRCTVPCAHPVITTPASTRTAELTFSTPQNMTGEYQLDYFVNGRFTETKVFNVSMQRVIRWEVDGAGVRQYALVMLNKSTGNEEWSYAYEVDFNAHPPTIRPTEIMGLAYD